MIKEQIKKDALDFTCPACDAPPGEVCVALNRGFAGRGPVRKTNRMRAPHPERKALTKPK